MAFVWIKSRRQRATDCRKHSIKVLARLPPPCHIPSHDTSWLCSPAAPLALCFWIHMPCTTQFPCRWEEPHAAGVKCWQQGNQILLPGTRGVHRAWELCNSQGICREPASSLTQNNSSSSGDGGGIDLDTICAKLCSSSRKLEMEWQLSSQNQVLHYLTALLADRSQSQGTCDIPSSFWIGNNFTTQCCVLTNTLDLPEEHECYIHIKRASRCWLEFRDYSG